LEKISPLGSRIGPNYKAKFAAEKIPISSGKSVKRK
jgi:hypothetical protein